MTRDLIVLKMQDLWWKPWGYDIKITIKSHPIFWFEIYGKTIYSIRELVSIESGLRQFVCEKWLYREESDWYCDYNPNITIDALSNFGNS